jgi:hypothetical protein
MELVLDLFTPVIDWRNGRGREIWAVKQMDDGEIPRRNDAIARLHPHSHSIVPGGLDVMS